jgi:Ca2+-binding RTX toxin-like protein
MAGGTGNDTYHVNHAGDVVTEGAGGGTDTILASVDHTLGATSQIEFLQAAAGAPGLDLTGNGLANSITGGDGDDVIAGGGRGDLLMGGLGADIFALLALATPPVRPWRSPTRCGSER